MWELLENNKRALSPFQKFRFAHSKLESFGVGGSEKSPSSQLLWELCERIISNCLSLIGFPSDMKSVLQDPELSLLQRCLLVSR